jgi:hypothetical protein
MAQINLKAPSNYPTAFLIADAASTTGGSNDSTPQLTEVDGETASIALEIQSVLGAVLLPRVSTTVMNSFTAVNGMIVYNTTANAIYVYQDGAWDELATGGSISLTAGNTNIVLSPSTITGTGTISLAAALTGITSVSSPASSSLVFNTNGSTAALTLSAAQLATFSGLVNFAGATSSTATGGSATLPADPVGFIEIEVAGVAAKIPYYST